MRSHWQGADAAGPADKSASSDGQPDGPAAAPGSPPRPPDLVAAVSPAAPQADPRGVAPFRPQRGETRVAGVVRHLSAEIVSGRLRPGTRLEEKVLAERFELSRTPIREALRQLAAIDLIEIRPHRGAIVTQVSSRCILEKFEFMAELEGLSAGFAARRMDRAERIALEALHLQGAVQVARGARDGYRDHNIAFHEAIYAGARNASLRETTQNLRKSIAAFRAAQFDLPERIAQSQIEHGRIVAAILAGDAGQATELTRRHILTVRDAVDGYLRSRPLIPI